MCFGGGFVAAVPEHTCWSRFWQKLALPEGQGKCIFVEVTRGCADANCLNACRAQCLPMSTMPFESLQAITTVLTVARDDTIPIVYYGMGDSSQYDWAGYIQSWKGVDRSADSGAGATQLLYGRINLPALMEKDTLRALPHQLEQHFTVNSVGDAVLVNELSHSFHFKYAVVVVSRKLDWLEIYKTLRVPTEYRSLTPSWSMDYVSADEFSKAVGTLGLVAKPREETMYPGFKPVIESCRVDDADIAITLRRCFQPDSKKVKISFPRARAAMRASLREDRGIGKSLDTLYRATPDCSKCTDSSWFFIANERRR